MGSEGSNPLLSLKASSAFGQISTSSPAYSQTPEIPELPVASSTSEASASMLSR